MSSCACSDLAKGLEGKRIEGVVGPELVLDLFSNSDLKEDTGFCQKPHSAKPLSTCSRFTNNGSFVCAISCRVPHGVDLCYRMRSESDFYAEARQGTGLLLKQLQDLK